MDLNGFHAGVFTGKHGYRSFSPSEINHTWTWEDPRINVLLAEANFHLGALNAFSLTVPDIDMFIRMHSVKEATKSSKIEGTRTNIEEALRQERDITPEKRDDWLEVQNYVAAMNHAIRRLRRLPLSTRILKETHGILMRGVWGSSNLPGEYRRSQNWIGGATIEDAVFVPPHHSEISALMGDLEKFLHNDAAQIPKLVRAAVAHYQFETIHPFLDGNGRLGRLLITLFLVSTRLLNKPTLYLSDYFEKHRSLYYQNLMDVRTSNSLSQWLVFFLVGVAETSKKGARTLQRVINLKEHLLQKKIPKFGKRASSAGELLDHLYRNPYVSAADVQGVVGISAPAANSLIDSFEKAGILKEVTGGRRNRVFEFEEYVKLFSERRG